MTFCMAEYASSSTICPPGSLVRTFLYVLSASDSTSRPTYKTSHRLTSQSVPRAVWSERSCMYSPLPIPHPDQPTRQTID